MNFEKINPIIIAISGKCRSGKDTLCDKIISILHDKKCKRYSFAEDLYEVCGAIQTYFEIPTRKDPQLLQSIGTSLKDVYGPDIWINRALNKLETNLYDYPIHIFTDCRFELEMEYLKSFAKNYNIEIKTIRVINYRAVSDRDSNHISEIDLDDYNFDYVIINNMDNTWDSTIRNILRDM